MVFCRKNRFLHINGEFVKSICKPSSKKILVSVSWLRARFFISVKRGRKFWEKNFEIAWNWSERMHQKPIFCPDASISPAQNFAKFWQHKSRHHQSNDTLSREIDDEVSFLFFCYNQHNVTFVGFHSRSMLAKKKLLLCFEVISSETDFVKHFGFKNK